MLALTTASPLDEDGFSVARRTDAVVTMVRPDRPDGPVTRFASHLEPSDGFRLVGTDLVFGPHGNRTAVSEDGAMRMEE